MEITGFNHWWEIEKIMKKTLSCSRMSFRVRKTLIKNILTSHPYLHLLIVGWFLSKDQWSQWKHSLSGIWPQINLWTWTFRVPKLDEEKLSGFDFLQVSDKDAFFEVFGGKKVHEQLCSKTTRILLSLTRFIAHLLGSGKMWVTHEKLLWEGGRLMAVQSFKAK